MIIDLSTVELPKYLGSLDAPLDFELFWKKAFLEIDAAVQNIEPTFVKVNEHLKNVDCYEVILSGYRNAKLSGKLLKPKEPKNRTPAIVVFHGYGDSSPEWFSLYPYAANGFTVLALDIRGQGGFSQDNSNFYRNTFIGQIVRGIEEGPEGLFLRKVYLDCVLAVRFLFNLDWVDEDRVTVLGASQGGGLAISTAGLIPEIYQVISIYPFLSDFKRVWEIGAANEAYSGITEYFRKYDPQHRDQELFFSTLNYVDVQHFAPKIKAEVLFIVALKDNICPPSTQYAIYNKINSKKEIITYPDFGHEPLKNLNDEILSFLILKEN